MEATSKPLRIAVIGPRSLEWSESSDMSIVAAALCLMGHEVISIGDSGETNLALKRGATDVGALITIAPNSLPELDSVDCAIVFKRPGIQEAINDLGIIVDSRWVYLKTGEDLDNFAETAVNLLSGEGIVI